MKSKINFLSIPPQTPFCARAVLTQGGVYFLAHACHAPEDFISH